MSDPPLLIYVYGVCRRRGYFEEEDGAMNIRGDSLLNGGFEERLWKRSKSLQYVQKNAGRVLMLLSGQSWPSKMQTGQTSRPVGG